MSFTNHSAKEVNFLIVYWGPPLSGRSTNLKYSYRELAPEKKSKLTMVKEENILFFSFILPLSKHFELADGYSNRFHLYTFAGEKKDEKNEKRKNYLLQSADGYVFVADSQIEKFEANLKSMEEFKVNLDQAGREIKHIRLIIQYNKRDLPNISSVEKLRSSLNPDNHEDIEAVATSGQGVFKTIKRIWVPIFTNLFIEGFKYCADSIIEKHSKSAFKHVDDLFHFKYEPSRFFEEFIPRMEFYIKLKEELIEKKIDFDPNEYYETSYISEIPLTALQEI